MRDSLFRLQDKSVLVFGDFNGLTQALIRDFTENGADVGFINPEKPQPARFLSNINDAREVHADFGRAAQIEVEIRDKNSAFEAVSKMAELFGRIDILIDTKMASLSGAQENLPNCSALLLEQIEPFFKSKKRGRIVFVREDESSSPLLPAGVTETLNQEFLPWTKSLCKAWPAPSYGINSVAVGITEDLLLKKFPKNNSIRTTMENVQKEHPHLQLVDSTEITSAVMFLSSNAASGISGQTLRVARSA